VAPLDLPTALALALLAAGVVGSVVPLLPGGLLSLAGVYLHWWSTGFGPPGPAFVAVATLVALAAIAADHLGGALAAGVAGASARTAAVAGLVGLALFPVLGPLGVFVGAAGVVYVSRRRAGADRRNSLRAAATAAVGLLVANLVELLLTLAVLVGFVVVVVL